MVEVFERVEKKYILSKLQYEQIKKKIAEHVVEDQYGPSTICNIYYDTVNYDLIRNSLEKPVYKEKVRLRSYNIPTSDSKVFLEIKKKFDGIVYKRRIAAPLNKIYDYLQKGMKPTCNQQIMKELDFCFHKYHLKPVLFLAYDRRAYYDEENENFRITFDSNIISRDYDLRLEKGVYGELLSRDSLYIMEVKGNKAMPLWFARTLSELAIYPSSFSKYGTVYKKNINLKIKNF